MVIWYKVEEGIALSIIIFLLIISETGGLKKEMCSSRSVFKRSGDAGGIGIFVFERFLGGRWK